MSFSSEKISIENADLCQHFSVNSTICENPDHYNNYLKQNALMDYKQGLGVTYLYIDTDDITQERKLMGYITLRSSSLIKDMGERKKFGYPAIEISELAVSEKYSLKGMGTEMVADAILIAEKLNKDISIKYVVLCADPSAETFYSRSPLNFMKMHEHIDDIPRAYANMNCTPMYLKLR